MVAAAVGPRQHIPVLAKNFDRPPPRWFGKRDPQRRNVLAVEVQAGRFEMDRHQAPRLGDLDEFEQVSPRGVAGGVEAFLAGVVAQSAQHLHAQVIHPIAQPVDIQDLLPRCRAHLLSRSTCRREC